MENVLLRNHHIVREGRALAGGRFFLLHCRRFFHDRRPIGHLHVQKRKKSTWVAKDATTAMRRRFKRFMLLRTIRRRCISFSPCYAGHLEPYRQFPRLVEVLDPGVELPYEEVWSLCLHRVKHVAQRPWVGYH